MSSDGRTWSGDVVVVGAGPAGQAAARQLTQSNLTVLLTDENQRPGGQIHRQPFVSVQQADAADRATSPGGVFDRGLHFLPQAVCHGSVGDGRIGFSTPSGSLVARARAIIVATGGLERVLPVPGWTTPGAMTAGAAQTFLKGSRSFPYRKVIVAGSGPILLATAAQLVKAGVTVSAIVEAVRLRSLQFRDVPRLVAAPGILVEGAKYIGRLVRARVPVYTGMGVAEIQGKEHVTGVRLRRLEADWSYTDGHSIDIDCDAVLLSHGFTSNYELAAELGAEIIWDECRQTWRPDRDQDFCTSLPNVLAVGDCAGVGGVKVSTLEGAIAGATLAARLSGTAPPRDLKRMRRRLALLEIHRRGMDRAYRMGTKAVTGLRSDTVVCRCQETTVGQLHRALDGGARDLHGVKLWSRAGMGSCQGRVCTPILMQLLTEYGQYGSDMRPPHVRFPVRPITGRDLADFSADSLSEG